MPMLYSYEGGRKDKTKTDYESKFKFETHVINLFWLARKRARSMRSLIQLDMVDLNGIPKELRAEPYEVGNSQVRF